MKKYIVCLVVAACPACDDDKPDTCERQRAFLRDHRTCSLDSDCVIVGGCSGSFGFAAVERGAAGEAQSISDDPSCGWQYDGPLYDAVCEQGQCTARATEHSCGEARRDASLD